MIITLSKGEASIDSQVSDFCAGHRRKVAVEILSFIADILVSGLDGKLFVS